MVITSRARPGASAAEAATAAPAASSGSAFARVPLCTARRPGGCGPSGTPCCRDRSPPPAPSRRLVLSSPPPRPRSVLAELGDIAVTDLIYHHRENEQHTQHNHLEIGLDADQVHTEIGRAHV